MVCSICIHVVLTCFDYVESSFVWRGRGCLTFDASVEKAVMWCRLPLWAHTNENCQITSCTCGGLKKRSHPLTLFKIIQCYSIWFCWQDGWVPLSWLQEHYYYYISIYIKMSCKNGFVRDSRPSHWTDSDERCTARTVLMCRSVYSIRNSTQRVQTKKIFINQCFKPTKAKSPPKPFSNIVHFSFIPWENSAKAH